MQGIRLRRPRVRAATAGFGLNCLTTTLINNPGYAVSVTHAYRITLTLRVTKREIILLDIGTHDEVYR